jgi:hypothetical protein
MYDRTPCAAMEIVSLYRASEAIRDMHFFTALAVFSDECYRDDISIEGTAAIQHLDEYMLLVNNNAFLSLSDVEYRVQYVKDIMLLLETYKTEIAYPIIHLVSEGNREATQDIFERGEFITWDFYELLDELIEMTHENICP